MRFYSRLFLVAFITFTAHGSFAQQKCEDVFTNEDARRIIEMNHSALLKAMGRDPNFERYFNTLSDKTITKFEDFCSEKKISLSRGVNQLTFLMSTLHKSEIKEFKDFYNNNEEALISSTIDVARQLNVFEMNRFELDTLLNNIKIFQQKNSQTLSSETIEQAGRYGGVVSIALYADIHYPSAAVSIAAMKEGRQTLSPSELNLKTREMISQLDTAEGKRQKGFLSRFDFRKFRF